MKVPYKTVLCCGAVLIAVTAALVHLREPRYNGHSLSYWGNRYIEISKAPDLCRADGSYSPEPGKLRALAKRDFQDAIQALGADGIPYLLDELCWKPSLWQKWILRFKSSGNAFVFPDIDSNYHVKNGIDGFQILGTNAVPALPKLARLLSSPEFAGRTKNVLPYLGDAAFPLITNALCVTTSSRVRMDLIEQLDAFPNRKREAASILLSLADDSDELLRWTVAKRFCDYDVKAEAAIPFLIEGLSKKDEARFMYFRTLQRYGNQAAPAIPVLEKLRDASSGSDREMFQSAIDEINRYVARAKMNMYQPNAVQNQM